MLDKIGLCLVVVVAVARSGVALCYSGVLAWKWLFGFVSSFILLPNSIENVCCVGCRQESGRNQPGLDTSHHCFAVAKGMEHCAKVAQGSASLLILNSSSAAMACSSAPKRRKGLGKPWDAHVRKWEARSMNWV
jgi:hypothetical protein